MHVDFLRPSQGEGDARAADPTGVAGAADPAGDASALLSAELARAVAERLMQHGFRIARLPDAYWQIDIHAAPLSLDASIVHGVIRMRALSDFEGRARRYDTTSRGRDGTLDYQILHAWPAERTSAVASETADRIAAALTPHRSKACADWSEGLPAEEARLETIRRALVAEIEEVRRHRRERERQRKDLEITPALEE